jgi:hypothetical protein
MEKESIFWNNIEIYQNIKFSIRKIKWNIFALSLMNQSSQSSKLQKIMIDTSQYLLF